MSATLKLSKELLDLGRHFLDCGREQDALQTLSKIPHLADMTAVVAIETQLELAQIYLRRRKWSLVRRHVNIVLAWNPECGHAHYLLASSFFQDDERDLLRAVKHYRRAIQLAPGEPAYAADCGLCLLELGRTTAGLRLLEKAAALAPDDLDYVRDLALSLLNAGQAVRARQAALAALFRQPGSSDARKLWNEVRFHEARREQSERPLLCRDNKASGPVLLPFRRNSAQTGDRQPAGHETLKFPSATDRAALLRQLRKKRRQSS